MSDASEIAGITGGLERGADGIWRARASAPISYPAHGNQFNFEVEDRSFWFAHRNRCLIELLGRYPANGTFFDIGGGNGCVSAALQRAGFPVVLVEPGPDGARNARAREIEHVICATLQDAGLADACVPAAGVFDVIEHIQDDGAFLRSLWGALHPGGRLYVTVPGMQSLWSQEDEDAGHYRRYSTASLRSALQGAGFRVEYATYFFQSLPVPILMQRTLPYRLGIRFQAKEVDNRLRNQHDAGGGAIRKLLAPLLERELAVIRRGGVLSFGSSCLAVASKG